MDNKFFNEGLQGLEHIYDRLKNVPQSEAEVLAEIEVQTKENPSYKFKTVNDVVNDIVSQLYPVLIKVQGYSKCSAVHRQCVKFTLIKGKVLLALKSVIFLERNHPNSYDYLEALFLFRNYVKGNESKINPEFLKIASQQISLGSSDKVLENIQKHLLENERNPIVLAENNLKIAILFNNKSLNSKIVIDNISNFNRFDFRAATQKVSKNHNFY